VKEELKRNKGLKKTAQNKNGRCGRGRRESAINFSHLGFTGRPLKKKGKIYIARSTGGWGNCIKTGEQKGEERAREAGG